MKLLDEFRDPTTAARLLDRIAATVTRDWTLMEVCGGQTHAIIRHGIDQLLPAGVTLLHGPGCPVCVTPAAHIDKALEIAARPDVVFCTFADMMRVPGSRGGDLFAVRARGGDVRMVSTPTEAVALAQAHPDREVVFFAVGFETTAPANAMAAVLARRARLENFSLLVSQVLVPPALEAILAAPGNRVQGFLAAGHVCTVTGIEDYAPIVARHRVPIVVTGFEPVDILEGVLACLQQLEAGQAEVENRYARWVKAAGNPQARQLLGEVFEVVPRHWRGIGVIPASGLALRAEWRDLDAEARFGAADAGPERRSDCISGLVLQGARKPSDCPAFGTRCTPEKPLGATMVSSEGACAAYWRYRGAA